MSQDALSDLLRCVRLRGAVFFHVACSGQWVTEAPHASVMASTIMPELEHVMEYHVLLKGFCWAGITGAPGLRMDEGDVIVFPHGDAHVMSSVPGLRAPPDPEFLKTLRGPQLPFILLQNGDQRIVNPPWQSVPDGGSDVSAVLLCGFLGCDRGPFNPLLSALPRLIHVPCSELTDDTWTARLARQAAAEAQARRPGGEAVLERMSEMMFVDVVRRHLESLPADQTGWLAGLQDRHVGPVLSLIHERPGHGWTLERFSGHAGLSRSALHDRFVHIIGQPPMQYLKNWRMQVASRLLIESNAKLVSIAQEVGYGSEAAFSRTFKRTVGMAPAEWRRRRLGTTRGQALAARG